MLIKIIVFGIFATSTSLTECKKILTAAGCSKDEWQCRDEKCIPFDAKCDGVRNCPDGSDETFALCRNMQCQSNWFKCTYGACVDGTAPCNGVTDCADSSDEMLARCHHLSMSSSKNFICEDGTEIPFSDRCDGVINCGDGSDELLKTCAGMSCLSYYFQCAYGACVDHGAECNGIKDCADNSDETYDLCGNLSTVTNSSGVTKTDSTNISITTEKVRVTSSPTPIINIFISTSGTASTTLTTNTSSTPTTASTTSIASTPTTLTSTATEAAYVNKTKMCKLPPYPEHGKYIINHADNVGNMKDVKPGQEYESFYIKVTCDEGYGVIGKADVLCFSGDLFEHKTVPNCVKFCELQKAQGTTYRCRQKGRRGKCRDFEPPGTIAVPECNKPVYYSPIGSPTQLTCLKNGKWDGQAVCLVECGKITSPSKQLMIGGKVTKHGEFPWHAAIYRKDKNEKGIIHKTQICGGTLISTTVVVSAAHCFWNDITKGKEDASNYAVGLGKIYRRWHDPKDDAAEYFDLTCLKIPDHYDGVAGNFQADIALLKMNKPVEYNTYIRPICKDLKNDMNIEMKVGRVAGWGFTSQEGNASPVLKYVNLPFVDLSKCKKMVPYDFRGNLVEDKFCAGDNNGTALCQGDSGGGLVFPDNTGDRYFLKGIVSTAPVDNNVCNKYAITTFTDVSKHVNFITNFNCDT